MNRTYKVIWSKARHCYVVVSELTKSQHKSSSKSELISTNVHLGGVLGKAAVAAIVAGLLTFGGVAYSPVLADTAKNPAGSGDGVAIGESSTAPKAENVAIGKGLGFPILTELALLQAILLSAVGPILTTMPVRAAALPLVKMQR